jgi:segregation and condensation protein A
MSSFTIRQDAFEGPLDLLLSLIQERKLYINEISLAQVTDEYLGYVQRFSELPMEETAQFILVASTLLLIKSRSLLPDLDLTDEEEGDIDDLERRLKYYRLIKHASRLIRDKWNMQPLRYSGYRFEHAITFSPEGITIGALHGAIRDILSNLPTASFRPTAHIEASMTLEEMISRLEARLLKAVRMKFSELSSHAPKADRIVQFLAVLELVRAGLVTAEQSGAFSDIVLETDAVMTPHYDV